MDKISIITTSKNRLDHLKQTLPLMCKQSNCEVIVVDYNCSQGTHKWVSKNFPDVKSIRITDDPCWSPSRARNIGAKYAKGNWFLFVDADVKIKDDLGTWIIKNCKSNRFYKVLEGDELAGSFVCSFKAYYLIGGYDEAFRGWGGEDLDLYKRLKLKHIFFKKLPSHFFEALYHSNSQRELDTNVDFDPKIKSRWIFRTYMFQKFKYFHENKEFPSFEQRVQMWKKLESKAKQLNLSQLKNFPKEKKPFKNVFNNLKKTFLYDIYLRLR